MARCFCPCHTHPGTIQDFEQVEATHARLIEALDLAEQYIASWAERGDEGAKVVLRMIVERRAIRG